VDFDEWFLSVVALLDVVCCFFLLPLSIYIAVKGYSESEKDVADWAALAAAER
jgi:hypothetical protein